MNLYDVVPTLDQVGASLVCSACGGFGYTQPRPGRFAVCECGSSGLDGVRGDREPGEVVRDSYQSEAWKGDKSGDAQRATARGERPRGRSRELERTPTPPRLTAPTWKNFRAYQLRAEGVKWSEIGYALTNPTTRDSAKRSGSELARAYAKETGAPWPPVPEGVRT